MSNQRLLATRLCELDVNLKTNGLHSAVERLYQELDQKGLKHFKPKVYLGDEWFCPEDSTLISVPFYLTHPRLVNLEKLFVGRVEGVCTRELMKLLRHEAGHCFNHALRLYRTRDWQKLFGSPNQAYDVERYEYDPNSKKYVQNLKGHYAQSHPDEDFAETFAVWLSPRSNWRKRYSESPIALKKLSYVDQAAKQIIDRPLQIKAGRPMSEVRYLKSTIASYYLRRIRSLHH